MGPRAQVSTESPPSESMNWRGKRATSTSPHHSPWAGDIAGVATVYKSTLEGRRNRYEDEALETLKEALAPGVRVTILPDRGFGDQRRYGGPGPRIVRAGRPTSDRT